MLAGFMSDEAVIASLSKPVEFPEKQMTWIKKTLADHADVRWTFLFLHEPAWENPSESFKAIQKLLKDRDHTFFAGHLHYYDYDNIDGHEHITMGPAGASFHQEGPGNVDHIMWVTMTDDGPQMGNIAFDRKGPELLAPTTAQRISRLDPEPSEKKFGAYDRKGLHHPHADRWCRCRRERSGKTSRRHDREVFLGRLGHQCRATEALRDLYLK